MDSSSSSEDERPREEGTVGPPPRKLFKTEAIPITADAAMILASALDLESPDFPKDFKCSVCLEVPPEEVYQCEFGHPICKKCQLRNRTGHCPLDSCHGIMHASEWSDEWIRCQVLENILDSHRFACPFKKNGCQVALSRQDIPKHKRDCVFDDRSVQICKYFYLYDDDYDDVEPCNYETCVAKPVEAIQHLTEKHNGGDEFSNYFIGGTSQVVHDLHLVEKEPWIESVIITKKNGGIFLIGFWVNSQKDSVSIACLLMNKPRAGQPEATLELSLESERVEIPNWKVTVPIVSVVNARAILKKKPVNLSWSFLKNYVDHNMNGCCSKDHVRMKIDIL